MTDFTLSGRLFPYQRIARFLLLAILVGGASNLYSQYCDSKGNCGALSITLVECTGDNGTAINNVSGCSGGYQDFTSQRVTMTVGTPYTVAVNYTGAVNISNALAAVYIDWNNDSVFDPNEGTSSVNVGGFQFVVTPIATASGLVRMRIITSNGSAIGATIDPCGDHNDEGETEDYSVLVLLPTETVPECINKTLATPKDSASGVCQNMTFKWSVPTDANRYKFSLFNGSTAIVKDSIVTTTEFTPANLLTPGTTYRWIAIPMADDQPAYLCDTLSFTTSVNSDPKITMLPARENFICEAEQLTFNGNPSNGSGVLKHSWNGTLVTNDFLSDTSISNPVFDGAFTGVVTNTRYGYKYSVVDTNGCKAADSIYVTVKPKPTTGTTLTPPGICEGDSAQLIIDGSNGTSFTWEKLNTNWEPVTLLAINDSIFSTGVLTSTATYRMTARLGNCTKLGNEVTVEVNPIPVKPLISTTTTEACDGDTILLLVFNHTTGVRWNVDPVVVNTSLSVTSEMASLANGKFVATVSNMSGCEASSDTISLEFHANPVAPQISNSGSNPACEGQTIVLRSDAVGNNSWSNGSNADTIVVNLDGTFTVTQTNSFGCTATSAPYSQVFVANPTKPTITMTSTNPLCVGSTATLQSSSSANNKWSTGSTTQSIVVDKSGKYAVKVTNATGCSTVSDSTELVFNALPTKPIITPNGNQCQGDTIYLLSDKVGGNLWSTTETTDSIPVAVNGTFTVTYTDANGCKSTSNQFKTVFQPIPNKPSITKVGNGLRATAGGTTYQWYDTTGAISGATSRNFQPVHGGYYWVVAISATGCESVMSDSFRYSGDGIFEMAQQGQMLSIYPNPNNGSFNVELPVNVQDAKLTVFDMNGRAVYTSTFSGEKTQVASNLEAGLYFIHITSATHFKVQKFEVK